MLYIVPLIIYRQGSLYFYFYFDDVSLISKKIKNFPRNSNIRNMQADFNTLHTSQDVVGLIMS